MAERYKLTDKGVEQALEILECAGCLPEATDDDENVNTLLLKAACSKYVTESKAKGDKRTDQEVQDVLVVCFLEAHLEARVRRIIN